MAYTYYAGEKKTRPGIYHRYSKNQSETVGGALNGVVAFAMAANWGPIDKVTAHETEKSIRETYGTGESVEAACSIIAAGASTVYIKRVAGADGSKGTADIGTAIRLHAKYESSRTLTVMIKELAGDATRKQIVVREDTKILETLLFAVSEEETAAFLAAVAESAYITAEKLADGVITAGEYSLTGSDPAVTAADYADAFYALEPYRYNVLSTDSIDADVFAVLSAYAIDSYENGKLIMAVGGTTSDTEFEVRLENAKACNSERIIYFGGCWTNASGDIVKGAPAIAHVAGYISSTPANKSIVHKVITGATDVPEKLTNSQYVKAIENGLLLVSMGPNGQVWFDAGMNTLTVPTEEQDDGWKKIRRVKTRYELMDRIDVTLAPKIGNINCDADGIAYIIQCATGVIKEMIAEGKLTAGSFYEDPENAYAGDSAWFIIECDDLDSLEKIYLHYKFRYSAN